MCLLDDGSMKLWNWKGRQAGTFSDAIVDQSSQYDVNNITNRVVAGDFDGDGLDDICAFYDYGNSLMKLWKWKGALLFLHTDSFAFMARAEMIFLIIGYTTYSRLDFVSMLWF